MVVIILEKVPVSLRGELSRWMIEPKAGVFVGKISGMVRDKLWEKCCQRCVEGSCIMIWSSNNEQGFLTRSFGDPSRQIINIDGLQLICIP